MARKKKKKLPAWKRKAIVEMICNRPWVVVNETSEGVIAYELPVVRD